MKRIIFVLILSVYMFGCGNSEKENGEYYSQVNDFEESKVEDLENENLEKIQNRFSDFENYIISETNHTGYKILNIDILCTEKSLDEPFSEKLSEVCGEDWFCWNVIYIEYYSRTKNRIISSTIEVSDGKAEFIQEYKWETEEKIEEDVEVLETENTEQNITNELTLLYQDEKVKIYFSKLNSTGIEFLVDNLTDKNITIQADSISINGFSSNDIIMSDDVAPKSIGKVVARCDDFSGNEKVETVSGQLSVIDFKDYNSYEATFTNVPIK